MLKFKKGILIGFCLFLAALLVAPVFVVAGDKVNINTANKEGLTSLNGIGPVVADRIIEYREKIAPFKKKEDIKKIKGIGEKTYEKIKDFIVVE
jgi:comEA protein